MRNREIEVDIFTGFLDAGKTTFIQSTMEDKRFNDGKTPTLLLLCEEGEVEYDLSEMPNVKLASITKDELNEAKLDMLVSSNRAEKVVVEYNGMWLMNDFFEAMPEDWAVYQVMFIADSQTFTAYNANMRQLCYDKMNIASMIAFNRLDGSVDFMDLHKLVRGANRQCRIVYEYKDGTTKPDEIVDPMPFDVNAPVIEIADRDFALFFGDVMDNPKTYNGKTVRFKGIAARDDKMPKGSFACGRHIMTCCAADIQYYCWLCEGFSGYAMLNTGDWIILEAQLNIKFSRAYGKKGPVLKVIKVTKCEPLPNDEAVATFY